VTSDHGEDMEEHNAPFEHRETYECNVGVPLIVKPPHGWPLDRKRIEPIVGHIDVLPTILGIAGLEAPKGVEGKSLLPLMSGDVQSLHPHLFTHGGAVRQKGRWQSGEVAIRTQDHKYIVRGEPIAEPGHARLEVSVLAAPPWRGDRSRPPADFIHYFNRLPKQELYDLRADPCEINEIAAASPDKVAELRDLLASYVRRRPDLFAGRIG
jgi:arylsulfatase A-like enzyme